MLKIVFRAINLRNDVRSALCDLFDRYLKQDMNVYDIGCGDKPFAGYLSGKVNAHIGVDIEEGFYDRSHIDLIGSAYDVPAEDNVADAIISSQVIEHLDQPFQAFSEKKRLLKKGGLLFLSFPFLYPIHAEPHDFTRFSEYHMNKILSNNDMELVELKRIGGFWYIIGMYLAMYLDLFNRGPLRTLKIITALSWLVRWFFLQVQRLEGLFLQLLGKKPENIRAKWTVNYVLLARKVAA